MISCNQLRGLMTALLLILSTPSFANIKKPTLGTKSPLLESYKKNLSKKEMVSLKQDTIRLGGKAIPILIKVMKGAKYPDKNRWMATFLVGKIMGKKSVPFISKFLEHPNWVLRMASLKTLLSLKQNKLDKVYAKALKDKSLIVRSQALQNIRKLNVVSLAPNVWSMLYDKRNYYSSKKGNKRAHIVKSIIRTMGDLKFKKSLKPMLSMIQKKRYKDIFLDLDYSLEKITGKKSPDSDQNTKMRFWNKLAISQKII